MSSPLPETVPVLPTAELHLHIEGTLEPELAFALAARNGVALPYADLDELRRAYAFTRPAVLPGPLLRADGGAAHRGGLRRPRRRLSRARGRAQGVRHAEIFFDPQAHTGPRRAARHGHRGPGAGARARRGAARLSRPADHVLPAGPVRRSAAEDLSTRRCPICDRITGVGLDSAEVGHPPRVFREVYARAADEGLHRVAHAGEEGPPEYIREALDRAGRRARRPRHCAAWRTRTWSPGSREEQVPLTVCPLSNVAAARRRPASRSTRCAACSTRGCWPPSTPTTPRTSAATSHDNVTAVTRALGLTAAHRRRAGREQLPGQLPAEADKQRHLAAVAQACSTT